MKSNMSITIRAMLFVSVAITISMISLLFLVETSIKNHFLDLDNETIDNKTMVIEQFSKRMDAVQRIINWDTTNPDSNFYIEILRDGDNIYRSERDSFVFRKFSNTLIHVSGTDASAPHKYLSKTIYFKKTITPIQSCSI
ncbi:hypothetical protein ACTFBW_21855 [Aeromonas rivipollensis]